jgi:hypothetical protein
MSMELFSLGILTRVMIVLFPLLSPGKPDGTFQALLLNASYVQPIRSNVGGTLYFSNHNVKSREAGTVFIVGGSAGQGGMQVHGGMQIGGGQPAQPVGDVRAVITRTWNSPSGASANSTYVGAEVGVGLIVRFSVGYAKRISGPSRGDDRILTWGAGLQLPVWVHQRD